MQIPASARLGLAVFAALPLLRSQEMTVSSFDGPVTSSEVSSFITYLHDTQPVVWPNTTDLQNEYAQGHTGEEIKAMGLMYELTGNTTILDRMIYYCDVLLEERNDILAAPYGQRTVWTNTIAPVWPGNTTNPASADGGDGDSVGHLAYCARLILQTPSILNTPVGVGDVYGHGATYGARAATFIAEADYTVSQFFLPDLINLSNSNELYYSASSPYMTNAVFPWNQQMMILYGLENLAQSHAILGDNPSLVTQYDGIGQTAFNWFFTGGSTVVQTDTDAEGNSAYNWGYAPSSNAGEDSNHGSLDCAGFYRAYLLGRYSITSAQMQPLANMFADVMTVGLKNFSGRVDGTNGTGHGSWTDYARSGYLLLTDFRPDDYYNAMTADLSAGGSTTSTDTFSRFLWVKNRRYLDGYVIDFSPVPGIYSSAQSVSLSTLTSGATIRYTTDGSTPTSTYGTVYTGPFNVSATTNVQAISYTSGAASPVSSATYSFPPGAPALSPNGGIFTTAQSVTITSSTPGASIRYTTDGSIPSATTGTLYTGPVSVSAATTLTAIASISGAPSSTVSSASYEIGAPTSAPTISPGSGTYSSSQTVTLSSGTSGASIYYTTDGSTPTTGSTLYSGPFTIAGSLTLKTIASASGYTDSPVSSASYTLTTAVGTPTITPAAGTYNSEQTVSISSTTPGATVMFTVDGSAPNGTSGMAYIYLKPFKVAANQTVKAYAYAPGMNSSGISSAAYVINDPVPSGWSDADVGAPPIAGGASYSSGTFTVSGCGADIWGSADQFNYAYQPASGDFTITSEVTSVANTNAWAKAGVMARASLADDDTFVDVFVTPGKGVAMQYRTATDGACTNVSGPGTVTAPYWVRLTRSGNLFTAYSSPNGSTWTSVGSVTITMPPAATAGLEVCSHNTSSLCTGTFTNVALQTAAPFAIASGSVTASGYHSGYPPSNTVDGVVTVTSRWACSGTSWIQYDLGAVHTVTSVNIAWSYVHIYPFSIAVSTDGSTWTTGLANQDSNGTALEFQPFELPPATTARYVRFNCSGSSYDGYTNISETQVLGY